jgi:hypothetical protein
MESKMEYVFNLLAQERQRDLELAVEQDRLIRMYGERGESPVTGFVRGLVQSVGSFFARGVERKSVGSAEPKGIPYPL